MSWTVEIGRKLRGKPAAFTAVFGARTPRVAEVVAGEPFATALARRGCDEYLLRDGSGAARARVWLSPDGRRGVLHEPAAAAPARIVSGTIQGGPRTLAWLRDGALHPAGTRTLPPALVAAAKAAVLTAKKGGATKPAAPHPMKARWTRRVPRDLAKLDALERAQLSAAARGLGAASLPKLLAKLEKDDVDVELAVLTGTSALTAWILGREDGVFFDATATRPSGITMSQGQVHDEKKRRNELVAAVQKAMDAICR